MKMKNKIVLIMAAVMIVGLTGCESHSTSSTEVEFSTSTDEGTTAYSYSSETVDGETTEESSVTEEIEVTADETDETESFDTDDSDLDIEMPESVETDGDKWSDDIYNMSYFVNDSGNIVIEVPETDTDYWRNIEINDVDATVEFISDEVTDDGEYYVELKATIDNGDAEIIMGHFTIDNGDEAVDFAIIDVAVENGEIVDVNNSGFTESLDFLE